MKKQHLQCLAIVLTNSDDQLLSKGLLFLDWLNSSFLAINAGNTCLLVGKLLLVTMWMLF